MFGYVNVNWKELPEDRKNRFGSVYCGVCRRIREQSGQLSRLGLRYDIAFLSTLLMSLYEPEEESGPNACALHPISKRPWVDNEFVRYGADMNVALAYYNCLDDWKDDRRRSAKAMAGVFGKNMSRIEKDYPRQCAAIARCIEKLSQLEQENCPNPDETANCFGELMAELLVCQEDFWAPTLREMGFHLGRFIYLLDAAVDFTKDKKHGKYNPYIAMGMEAPDWARWEDYLVLTMARCTACYERLPLVQDKDILDNALYSGVWIHCKGKKKEEEVRK
ncbi:MAG: hypothetical protein E7465_06330 [Ruminococcaceae bacterium]|nr:hypothetical protein [Oscillospiraceae bacterium]